MGRKWCVACGQRLNTGDPGREECSIDEEDCDVPQYSEIAREYPLFACLICMDTEPMYLRAKEIAHRHWKDISKGIS